jgi:hypothetical protein
MNGERSEIREFLRTDSARLVNAMALICGSLPAAEDAVQAALGRAYELSERGRSPETETPVPGYCRGSLVFISAVQPIEKVAFNAVRENVRVNDIPIHLFEALGLRDILVELSALCHN